MTAHTDATQVYSVIDKTDPGTIADRWVALHAAGNSTGRCDMIVHKELAESFDIQTPVSTFTKWRKDNVGVVRSDDPKDGRKSIAPRHTIENARASRTSPRLKEIEGHLRGQADQLDAIVARLEGLGTALNTILRELVK
jgi:hypothetical protein